MSVITEPQTEAEIKRESVIFSLEPKPPVATPSPSHKETESKPIQAKVRSKPKPKVAKGKPKGPSKSAKVVEVQSQFLELGEGFRIAHKPGSAYSVLYKVVAESGHFSATVKTLDGKPDLGDVATAKKLLSRMLVPIDELETLCRSESSWQEHATRKTSLLKEKADEGDEQASNVLKNAARASRGAWKGNIPEMVSTCVGSYAAFTKGTQGNKNVLKFADAKLLFRRLRTTEGNFVMMYPMKYEKSIEKAIKKVYGDK
jgi:hypothetical protein